MKSAFVMLLLSLAALPVSAQSLQDSLKEMNRKIDILTEEIEKIKLGEVAETKYEASRGLGPAASKVYQLKKSGVSLSGYGEAVYENYSRKNENGSKINKPDQFDYLRQVVYFGYRYNDWILFNSEVEFEHASTGKGGEVSVEFGYIELMFSKHASLRAGMILPPVGIINEKHEPSTFFGTLRPQVEQRIIPSTWRANGVGFYGEIIPNLNYRAYIVEGLDATKFSDESGIRDGRQNGAKSKVENFALTGKLEYAGLPGTILGASFYTGSSNQSTADSLKSFDAQTDIVSVHAEFAWKGIEARILYAQNTIGEAARISQLTGKTIGSKMTGWYGVAGYDVMPLIQPGTEHYLAPFVQYEAFNTHASVADGYTKNKAWNRNTLTMGLTYKPHPNVAFKFDYRNNSNKTNTGINQWNLAVNYLF